MKTLVRAALISAAIAISPAFGHHAAQGIVDEEIYAMIDTMLADTPHAEMTLEEIAVGMTELTITTATLNQMENLIDDGLLDYAVMLDGEVEVNITFGTDRSVTMTIVQTE